MRWHGHFLSAHKRRIPKKVSNIKIKGKRKGGRPRSRCHTDRRKTMRINWGVGAVGRRVERFGGQATRIKWSGFRNKTLRHISNLFEKLRPKLILWAHKTEAEDFPLKFRQTALNRFAIPSISVCFMKFARGICSLLVAMRVPCKLHDCWLFSSIWRTQQLRVVLVLSFTTSCFYPSNFRLLYTFSVYLILYQHSGVLRWFPFMTAHVISL
jgi:hypothetical protein